MAEQMRIVGQSSSSATSVHALRQSVGQKKASRRNRHTRLRARQRKSAGTVVVNMAESRRSCVRPSAKRATAVANRIISQKNAGKYGQSEREIQ